MGLAADNKAEPEPDVADEHYEANEEDEEDRLVVGGGARLLDLDEGGVVQVSAVHAAAALVAAARPRGAWTVTFPSAHPVPFSRNGYLTIILWIFYFISPNFESN